MGETGGVMPQAATPPPPSAPVATEKPKGAVGIWIGVLLIVGGIVLGIALVVGGAKSLLSGFDDLQRVPINGGGVVRIDDTGSQTIYAEKVSTSGGTSFNTSTYGTYAPDVAVRVIGPDGGDVTVKTPGTTETYTYDGRDGVSIGRFDAATAGEYRIVTRAEDGGFQPYTTIAVGQGLEWSGIGAILGGVFGGGLVVLIGIILVIVFAVRRSRSKKRIAQASAPYPAPGGGWPAAPGYAPSGYAPTGYAGGYAGGGYGPTGAPGAPGSPPAEGWPPASANPGWVPPPVAPPDPGGAGPTWSPPPPPAPADAPPSWQPPPSEAPTTWQPSGDAPAPEAPATWQPSGDAPAPGTGAGADPVAPSWEPPASDDAPPPPPPGGEGTSSS